MCSFHTSSEPCSARPGETQQQQQEKPQQQESVSPYIILYVAAGTILVAVVVALAAYLVSRRRRRERSRAADPETPDNIENVPAQHDGDTITLHKILLAKKRNRKFEKVPEQDEFNDDMCSATATAASAALAPGNNASNILPSTDMYSYEHTRNDGAQHKATTHQTRYEMVAPVHGQSRDALNGAPINEPTNTDVDTTSLHASARQALNTSTAKPERHTSHRSQLAVEADRTAIEMVSKRAANSAEIEPQTDHDDSTNERTPLMSAAASDSNLSFVPSSNIAVPPIGLLTSTSCKAGIPS